MSQDTIATINDFMVTVDNYSARTLQGLPKHADALAGNANYFLFAFFTFTVITNFLFPD